MAQSITSSNPTTTMTAVATPTTTTTTTTSNVQLSCIVCSNVARPSSIYCSDDCIRKHAQTTTAAATTTLPSVDASPTTTAAHVRDEITPIVANKNNRVDVYEPTTGRCLTGNSAPTVENLSQWLQTHQTFEVVHSGSAQALAIRAKKMQLKQLAKTMANSPPSSSMSQQTSPKIQTTLTVAPSKRVMLVNPHRNNPSDSKTGSTTPPTNRKNTPAKGGQKNPLKSTQQQQQLSPSSLPTKATTTHKSAKSGVQQSATTSAAIVPTPSPVQTPTSANKRKADATSPTASVAAPKSAEPVRVNVQRTLREQLQLRMAEQETNAAARLSPDEIDRFAKETEREMYLLFSRDTGTKYRAKYRSLMFNIKDRKNATLFRKICDKQLQPKQLVRMSAEELASQELAMWRENENKHQLEMIKKSELDLLACAKSYVLKTHKGEELMESKQTDRVQLDMNVSVEDVVSVLNNSIVSSTSESPPVAVVDALSLAQSTEKSTKDNRIDSRFEKYMDNSKHQSSSSSSSSNKKKAPKRSRSRSRDRDVDSKKNNSKHKRKRSRDRRSRSRSTDRSGAGGGSSSKNDKRSSSTKKNSTSSTPTPAVASTPTAAAAPVVAKAPPKPLIKENFNLIDKILEAQSTIDRILHPEENRKEPSAPPPLTSSVPIKLTADSESTSKLVMAVDTEPEMPSSTVTIPTPPESQLTPSPPPSQSSGKSNRSAAAAAINSPDTVWSGNIIMVDVATFQIAIQPIAGDCAKIARDLPVELDVVGRIRPDTVWEYISKIKKMQKEVLVVSFAAGNDDDQDAYDALFKYLTTRQRFGVIKTKSSTIKDFYVLPLDDKTVPADLLPPEMTFDDGGADLLIGVVVKNTPAVPMKRSATTSAATSIVVPNKVRPQ